MKDVGDRIRSVRMYSYDPAERGSVMLFRDHDCRNNQQRFDAAEVETQIAEYNYDDVKKVGKVSSVMVPYGYSLKMYSESGFRNE